MKSLAVVIVALLAPGLLHAGNFPMADFVIVEKGARQLHLLQDGEILRSFKIALGIVPVGDKEKEGDFKTPDYFLSIGISYPNADDRREAAAAGVDPGGAIMIHGQPNAPTRSEAYYRTQDWTNGCIAVTNSDMIDIWLMTVKNTLVEIRP